MNSVGHFFPNSSYSFNNSLIEIEFARNGHIKELIFSKEESVECKLKDSSVEDALIKLGELDQGSFFHRREWMFLKAFEQWKGSYTSWNEGEHLLCRCFGISFEEVSKFCQANQDITLKKLSENFPAGAGCGSCQDDLRKLMGTYRYSAKEIHEAGDKRIRIAGLSPMDAFIKASEIVSHILSEKKLNQKDFSFKGLKGNKLFISFSNNSETIDHELVFEIEKALFKAFDEEVILALCLS